MSQVAGVPATSWIADVFGWRYSFGFVVLTGLLALAILTPMLSRIPARTPASVEGETDRPFSLVVYGVLCVTFLVVVSEFIVYSYVSLFISGTILPGVPLLSTALFAYGAGAVTGNLACGILTDKMGPYRVLLASVTAQVALLVALIAFGQHGLLTVVIAFLWGNVSYMYLVPIQHRLLGLAGYRTKLVLAMNSSTIYAGIGTGASIGGWLVEGNGAKGLALASIIIGAAGIALALYFMRDRTSGQLTEAT
nr:MFS transporter [Puniceibacterium antarcticum]